MMSDLGKFRTLKEVLPSLEFKYESHASLVTTYRNLMIQHHDELASMRHTINAYQRAFTELESKGFR